ncbi:MAG TPA: epoxide hydrolase N-terminal domain-containing protein, partial [Pilimelia sp.]|nr:epoxide hydrolase N-terminal domain-containing protein [Pilimelia sp.]
MVARVGTADEFRTPGTRSGGPRWSRIAGTVVAVLALTSACTTDAGPAPTPTRPAAAAGAASFDSATRDDAEFNRRCRHEFADVDGVRMHYVTGGTGEPLVLLHGWPQSWFEWRGHHAGTRPAVHRVCAGPARGSVTVRERRRATTRPPSLAADGGTRMPP